MTVAIVGAAETTELGKIPDLSQIQLHADAALNALADAGLQAKDIDGVATAGESPVAIAHYLGIAPRWVDGSSVGGCSFMLHVRHAVAALEALVTPGAEMYGNGPRLLLGVFAGHARTPHCPVALPAVGLHAVAALPGFHEHEV